MKKHLLALFLLCLATALAYRPALHGEFQFDDAMGIERGGWYLPKDPDKRLQAWLASLAQWGGNRGLVKATYQLNLWVAGGNDMKFLDLNETTGPFHAFNIGLHLLTVAGLYTLLAWMTRRRGRPDWLPPLLGASLFALSPLATESVAYISARTGTMAACFGIWGILGLLAFGAPGADGRPRHPAARALGVGLLGLGSFLAIGCKETGWMIPPMGLAALFWSYLGDVRAFWRDWGLAALLGGAVFGIGIWVWAQERTIFSDDFLWQYASAYGMRPSLALPCHVATQLNAWWTTHLPRALLPCGIWHPTVDPAPPMLRNLSGGVLVLASGEALGVLALTLLAWRSWRRGGWGGLGWVWILLGVIPASFAALLDITAERHAYVPLLGGALAVAFPLAAAARRRPILAGACLTATLAGLGVLTSQRCAQWGTEVALWRAAIRDAPQKARPYYNMAKSLARIYRQIAPQDPVGAGRSALRADRLLRQSLKAAPNFHLAHGALARGLEFLGRREEAVPEFRLAIRCHAAALRTGEAAALHANQILVHTQGLAQCLHALGRDAEAEQDFRWAISYHLEALQHGAPQDLHAMQAALMTRAFARFLEGIGKHADARQALRDGLRWFPACRPLLEELNALEAPAGERR